MYQLKGYAVYQFKVGDIIKLRSDEFYCLITDRYYNRKLRAYYYGVACLHKPEAWPDPNSFGWPMEMTEENYIKVG